MRRLLMLALALVACLGLSLPAAAVTNGTYDGSNHPYVAYEDNLAFACTGTLLSPTVMLTAAHCFSDSTSGLGTNDTTSASQVRVNFDPNLINTPAAQRGWYVGAYYCPMGDADPIAGGVTESPEKVTLMTTGSMELSVPLDASSPHAVSPPRARSNAGRRHGAQHSGGFRVGCRGSGSIVADAWEGPDPGGHRRSWHAGDRQGKPPLESHALHAKLAQLEVR